MGSACVKAAREMLVKSTPDLRIPYISRYSEIERGLIRQNFSDSSSTVPALFFSTESVLNEMTTLNVYFVLITFSLKNHQTFTLNPMKKATSDF